MDISTFELVEVYLQKLIALTQVTVRVLGIVVFEAPFHIAKIFRREKSAAQRIRHKEVNVILCSDRKQRHQVVSEGMDGKPKRRGASLPTKESRIKHWPTFY